MKRYWRLMESRFRRSNDVTAFCGNDDTQLLFFIASWLPVRQPTFCADNIFTNSTQLQALVPSE